MEPDFSKLPEKLRIASERSGRQNPNTYYQGTIAYRQDGASHLDLY